MRLPGAGWRGAEVSLAGLVLAALLTTGCGLSPTAAPSASAVMPSPTPVSSARASIDPATGGTVSLQGGPAITVPPGGISLDADLSISLASTAAPALSDAWPAQALSPVYDLNLSAGVLNQPATLTLNVDLARLPKGMLSDQLMFAYRDETRGTWVPVAAKVEAGGLVTAAITHFSDWALFGFDLDRWLVVLKALASGQISDLTTSLYEFTTPCQDRNSGFSVDSTSANRMFEGCLDYASADEANVRVSNLRPFAIELSSPAGYFSQALVAPGESVWFTASLYDPSPALVTATMSSAGLAWSVADIMFRLLPGWSDLKASSGYFEIIEAAAAATKAAWDSSFIFEDLAAGRISPAIESTVNLLTGSDYLDAFAASARAMGAKYGLPWLTVVSADSVSRITRVLNLADLIVTTWSFFGDYFFNAETSLRVVWSRPVLPPAPVVRAGTVDQHGSPFFILSWNVPARADVSGFRLYYDIVPPSGGGCDHGSPTLLWTLPASDREASPVTLALYNSGREVAGAHVCYWLSSFNSYGESSRVLGASLLVAG